MKHFLMFKPGGLCCVFQRMFLYKIQSVTVPVRPVLPSMCDVIYGRPLTAEGWKLTTMRSTFCPFTNTKINMPLNFLKRLNKLWFYVNKRTFCTANVIGNSDTSPKHFISAVRCAGVIYVKYILIWILLTGQ